MKRKQAEKITIAQPVAVSSADRLARLQQELNAIRAELRQAERNEQAAIENIRELETRIRKLEQAGG